MNVQPLIKPFINPESVGEASPSCCRDACLALVRGECSTEWRDDTYNTYGATVLTRGKTITVHYSAWTGSEIEQKMA
jgi:hypothetical protein